MKKRYLLFIFLCSVHTMLTPHRYKKNTREKLLANPFLSKKQHQKPLPPAVYGYYLENKFKQECTQTLDAVQQGSYIFSQDQTYRVEIQNIFEDRKNELIMIFQEKLHRSQLAPRQKDFFKECFNAYIKNSCKDFSDRAATMPFSIEYSLEALSVSQKDS